MHAMPHGTPAAYNRHITHGTEPCAKCRDARYRYDAARHQARAEQGRLFRQLLDLIAGECRRAGMLP